MSLNFSYRFDIASFPERIIDGVSLYIICKIMDYGINKLKPSFNPLQIKRKFYAHMIVASGISMVINYKIGIFFKLIRLLPFSKIFGNLAMHDFIAMLLWGTKIDPKIAESVNLKLSKLFPEDSYINHPV